MVNEKMKQINIEFLLNMTKDYLDGKIDNITYGLDFPYEVETRYNKIIKEDKEMAEIIFDCLVEDAASLYDVLSEEKFRSKIDKEYNYIMSIYTGDFDII